MAHVKASGSKAHQGANVAGKRRGLKVGAGQFVNAGTILVRQVGTKIYPGFNTKPTRNFDIIATLPGTVYFTKVKRARGIRTMVNIKAADQADK